MLLAFQLIRDARPIHLQFPRSVNFTTLPKKDYKHFDAPSKNYFVRSIKTDTVARNTKVVAILSGS